LKWEDLAGAGVLGLLDAVRKFDARKHVKIETYARHRIRGAILDSLRSLDTATRAMRGKNKRAERVYRKLEARAECPVEDAEMAQALGISLKKWYGTVLELQPTGLDWLRPTQIPDTPLPHVQDLPAENAQDHFDLLLPEGAKRTSSPCVGTKEVSIRLVSSVPSNLSAATLRA
jgi:RNA polymerase sigma factor for flagellar operon FliA